MNEAQPAYGLIAEFSSPAALLHAARSAHGAGYRRVEAYSPMPVEGLAEALGYHGNRISLLALAGGILGGVLTFALLWSRARSITHSTSAAERRRGQVWFPRRSR